MKIFIAGSGKLANALWSSNLSIRNCEILKWESFIQSYNENAIVVHAGSGRELKEIVEFCNHTKSLLIELSTGLYTERMDPEFPLILCPNTSVLVLKALRMITDAGRYFENYQISITESHQAAKKSEAGTALAFAAALKFPGEKICSIRDPEIQEKKVGVPEAYLDKHAWHQIVIQDGSDQVTIETKVMGHDSYAKGVGAILNAVINLSLDNRKYTILELIGQNIL